MWIILLCVDYIFVALFVINISVHGIRSLLSNQWFVKRAVVYSLATRKSEVVA